MLNPSTATDTEDDPTIRTCMGFADRLFATTLEVVNLYAQRATKPSALPILSHPVGPRNDDWIASTVSGADMVIAAWGTFPYERMPGGRDRAERVTRILKDHGPGDVHCLAKTRHGFPSHPLYLPYGNKPEVWA
jgi:hypothetical protein